MVLRKYTTLVWLFFLTDMSVLVCWLDVFTLTLGWPHYQDLPFRQKAMVKTFLLNSVLINSVLKISVLNNSVLISSVFINSVLKDSVLLISVL